MSIRFQIGALALLFVASLCQPSQAADVTAGHLVIHNPWSRATPGNSKTGSGYLVVENKGTEPDRLLGGSTPAAGSFEIHEMSMQNNVMTMRPAADGLAIPPGQSVTLSPGGFHIMMMNLKAPLKQGDKIPATLQFEKAGKVAVTFDVGSIGAQGPASATTPDASSASDSEKMPMATPDKKM